MEDVHSWYLAFQHASPGSRNDLLVWHCYRCKASRTLFRLNGILTSRFLPAADGEGCEDSLVDGVMTE